MGDFTIVGVSRGNEYSPNHIGNDAAIFKEVADALRKAGCRVDVYPESEFVERGITADVIFDMARDRATIARLKELEQQGSLVVNSAFGIDNCIRQPMTELLLENGIPHPESVVLAVEEDVCPSVYPCWIKRGNSHALVREDVCYVTCREEALGVLTDFKRRNIPTAVVNEHLEGDLIKFYGVSGTDFFYWFYPSPRSHSKFGLEVINGEAKGFSFEEGELKAVCDRAAKVLNVPVYGGDCVVSADGSFKIIDFNDWPSFARCREEAGKAIATYIMGQIQKQKNDEQEED